MNLQEIISLTRYRLGNYEPPYVWVDAELVHYCNEAINTMCRDAYALHDSLTDSVCAIYASSGTADYALAPSVIHVQNAKVVTEELLILNVKPATDWAVGSTITGTTSTHSCVVVGKVSDYTYSVNKRTGAFTPAEELSDGVTAATQTGLYPKVTDYKTTDLKKQTSMNLNRRTPDWRTLTAGEPTGYSLDYNTGYVTLTPSPDDTYVIRLSVYRYPITAMTTTTDIALQTPELSTYLHNAIIDGICAQAFLKNGEQTFDAKKAEYFMALFKKSLHDFKKGQMYHITEEEVVSPHNAFI